MNKSMLTAYRERWKAVADIEVAEQLQTSTAQRWRKLNSLVRMAAELDLLRADEDAQNDVVRHRWNYLKRLYLAHPEDQTP